MDFAHLRIVEDGHTVYRKRVAVVGAVFYDIVLIPCNDLPWHMRTGFVGEGYATSSGFKSLGELERHVKATLADVNKQGKIIHASADIRSLACLQGNS